MSAHITAPTQQVSESLSNFGKALQALQIKARLEGISTPVYDLSEVHHLS
jgi:hypothetical protein